MSAKLKDLLSSLLNQEELELLVGSYDIVGDIAIIIVPDELLHQKNVIGEVILHSNKNVKVVARRSGYYGGEYRTIKLDVIAGEDRKETLITEFGVRLQVNVETTYFSVRSGNERRRVASLVESGEQVLVMFSGVGPYPLVIAKHSDAENVVGVEKNPLAHGYALQNLRANKRIQNVRFYEMDVSGLPLFMEERFDRIVMPLPTMGHLFLLEGLGMLKPDGGWLHYYEMAKDGAFDAASVRITEACNKVGRTLCQSSVTRCGHCGPRTHRICVDAQIL